MWKWVKMDLNLSMRMNLNYSCNFCGNKSQLNQNYHVNINPEEAKLGTELKQTAFKRWALTKGRHPKKNTGFFGNFSQKGGGGSSQFPKLLQINQGFFGMPKSFLGAKTCFTIVGRWYLSNLITLSWFEIWRIQIFLAKTRIFGNFFTLRGGGVTYSQKYMSE